MPVAMSASIDPDPNTQVLPTIPTVEEMNDWDEVKVLRWIQQRHPKLLKGSDLESFRRAEIIGIVFMVSDAESFQSEGVSRIRSLALQALVDEVNNSKFIPWT
jgi:hypothetical protein